MQELSSSLCHQGSVYSATAAAALRADAGAGDLAAATALAHVTGDAGPAAGTCTSRTWVRSAPWWRCACSRAAARPAVERIARSPRRVVSGFLCDGTPLPDLTARRLGRELLVRTG
ncbi:hypothetical protein ACFV2Q_00715 [Streptomyces sp. NPDC059650]|uniref:hypothetical protein n=1 Tax=Streptomyces sp. NPDC059650 TaxID=3346896 RepID=UPI0036BCAE2E